MLTGMILPMLQQLGTETEYNHYSAKPAVQISRTLTSASETPAPVELGPSGVYIISTGQIVLMQSIDELVRQAAHYMQDTAVLPIDGDDDMLVDQLISRQYAGVRAKPLTRKL